MKITDKMFFKNPLTIKPILNTMQVSTHPRVFVHTITVEIIAENEAHCIISFSNEKDKILRMMGVNLKQGTHSIRLDDLGTLTSGAYHLEVRSAEGERLYDIELTKQ